MTAHPGTTNNPPMAISDPPPNRTRARKPAWPMTNPADEALAYYLDWRADARAAAEAYAQWREAPDSEHATRFSAYTAALDQEEGAALQYAHAIDRLERSTAPQTTQST